MKKILSLICFIAISIKLNAQSQLKNVITPLGSGDRIMRIITKPCSARYEDLTVAVYYAENKNQLTDSNLGGASMGQAKYKSKNAQGEFEFEFIFPHADFPTPNTNDASPVSISTGKRVFTRILLQTYPLPARTISEIYEFNMPPKLTVALLGDSYGSGEGAPGESPYWTNSACHRSVNSGQLRAVKELKEKNKGLAIAYKHVSCSGAEIDELFEKKQITDEGAVSIQLETIKEWLTANNYDRLDILVMSVGGNDIGLIKLVTDYLYLSIPGYTLDLAKDIEIQDDIDDAIKVYLPAAYRQLNNYIRSKFLVRNILITEYPNPLNGADGKICSLDDISYCFTVEKANGSRAEYLYARDSVLIPFNNQIKQSANELGWKYVTGPFSVSANRGLCNCDNGYFNTFTQSVLSQGDKRGTFHPNANGHKNMYQPFLYASLSETVDLLRTEWEFKRLLDILETKRKSDEETKQMGIYAAKFSANQPKASIATEKLRIFKDKINKKIEVQRQQFYRQQINNIDVKNLKKPTLILDKYSIKKPDDN